MVLQEQINMDRGKFEKEKSKQNLEIHQEKQDLKSERDAIVKQRVRHTNFQIVLQKKSLFNNFSIDDAKLLIVDLWHN